MELVELYRLCFRVCRRGKRLAYQLIEKIAYYSPRYGKWITLPQWMISDGSTGGTDITSLAWWVHDRICEVWVWDDGTPITVWQSSMVLSDILKLEGRRIRARSWGSLTYLYQLAVRPFRSVK